MSYFELALFVAIGIVMWRLIANLRRSEAKQRDAAERLRAQYDALFEADLAQGQLAALVDSSNDAIVSKTLDGVITSWNAAAERLFGFPAVEAIGQPIMLIVPADRFGEEQRILERLRAGEHVATFETVRQRKDGTHVDVAVTISPIRSRAGEIVGASKIARDITEARRVERQREELLARERRALEEATAASDRLHFLADVSALLTSSLDYTTTVDRAVHLALPRLGDFCNVLVQDDHGKLRHSAWGHVVPEKEPLVRELAAALFETPGDKPTPTYAAEVMKAGKTIVAQHETLAAALARIRPLDSHVTHVGAQLRPHSYVGAPLLVRGRPIGVISFVRTADGSARDYTDSEIALIEDFARRVSPAIENARLFREADQLNRLKDEFLATVSHELRTPLSAILGWARLLSSGQLDADKAKRAVEIIERNTHVQSKLVDDILDVARGMAGNVQLETKPLDLASVAQRGVESVTPAAAAKKIQIDVRAASGVCVVGDAARLQQVVWNLLSNAVKFTPSGGHVTITVEARDGSAELEVTDTGAGIPAEFLPYVFDKFRQADGSFTRQYGGLGLGLAITRHLVELHGGTIEARSAGQGQGATFYVRLPGCEGAGASVR